MFESRVDCGIWNCGLQLLIPKLSQIYSQTSHHKHPQTANTIPFQENAPQNRGGLLKASVGSGNIEQKTPSRGSFQGIRHLLFKSEGEDTDVSSDSDVSYRSFNQNQHKSFSDQSQKGENRAQNSEKQGEQIKEDRGFSEIQKRNLSIIVEDLKRDDYLDSSGHIDSRMMGSHTSQANKLALNQTSNLAGNGEDARESQGEASRKIETIPKMFKIQQNAKTQDQIMPSPQMNLSYSPFAHEAPQLEKQITEFKEQESNQLKEVKKKFQGFFQHSQSEWYIFGKSLDPSAQQQSPTKRNMPIKFNGKIPLKDISMSSQHGVGLSYEGAVYTWGQGEDGQLGLGQYQKCQQPTLVSSLVGKNVKQISSSSHTSGCLTEDGHMYLFGNNQYCQIGIDNQVKGYHNPKIVQVTNEKEAVNDGRQQKLGNEYGNNQSLGSFYHFLFPKVPISVSKIACGPYHTCAVTSDGLLYTWGDGFGGKLGHKTQDSHPKPQLVESLLQNYVIDISCGQWHTCCIAQPRLGQELSFAPDTNQKIRDNPQISGQMSVDTSKINAYSTQNNLKEAQSSIMGDLFVWGAAFNLREGSNERNQGQLGLGDQKGRLEPTKLTVGEESQGQSEGSRVSNVKKVVCGNNFSCVLLSDGRVFQMGQTGADQSQAETGDEYQQGVSLQNRIKQLRKQPKMPGWEGALIPTEVGGPLENIIIEIISCGDNHVVASGFYRSTPNGVLYSWGKNSMGQLGYGNFQDSAIPQLVHKDLQKHLLTCKVQQIACGASSSMVLLEQKIQDNRQINFASSQFSLPMQSFHSANNQQKLFADVDTTPHLENRVSLARDQSVIKNRSFDKLIQLPFNNSYYGKPNKRSNKLFQSLKSSRQSLSLQSSKNVSPQSFVANNIPRQNTRAHSASQQGQLPSTQPSPNIQSQTAQIQNKSNISKLRNSMSQSPFSQQHALFRPSNTVQTPLLSNHNIPPTPSPRPKQDKARAYSPLSDPGHVFDHKLFRKVDSLRDKFPNLYNTNTQMSNFQYSTEPETLHGIYGTYDNISPRPNNEAFSDLQKRNDELSKELQVMKSKLLKRNMELDRALSTRQSGTSTHFDARTQITSKTKPDSHPSLVINDQFQDHSQNATVQQDRRYLIQQLELLKSEITQFISSAIQQPETSQSQSANKVNDNNQILQTQYILENQQLISPKSGDTQNKSKGTYNQQQVQARSQKQKQEQILSHLQELIGTLQIGSNNVLQGGAIKSPVTQFTSQTSPFSNQTHLGHIYEQGGSFKAAANRSQSPANSQQLTYQHGRNVSCWSIEDMAQLSKTENFSKIDQQANAEPLPRVQSMLRSSSKYKTMFEGQRSSDDVSLQDLDNKQENNNKVLQETDKISRKSLQETVKSRSIGNKAELGGKLLGNRESEAKQISIDRNRSTKSSGVRWGSDFSSANGLKDDLVQDVQQSNTSGEEGTLYQTIRDVLTLQRKTRLQENQNPNSNSDSIEGVVQNNNLQQKDIVKKDNVQIPKFIVPPVPQNSPAVQDGDDMGQMSEIPSNFANLQNILAKSNNDNIGSQQALSIENLHSVQEIYKKINRSNEQDEQNLNSLERQQANVNQLAQNSNLNKLQKQDAQTNPQNEVSHSPHKYTNSETEASKQLPRKPKKKVKDGTPYQGLEEIQVDETPGAFLYVRQNSDGSNDVVRIRLDKKQYKSVKDASKWWEEHKSMIIKKYNITKKNGKSTNLQIKAKEQGSDELQGYDQRALWSKDKELSKIPSERQQDKSKLYSQFNEEQQKYQNLIQSQNQAYNTFQRPNNDFTLAQPPVPDNDLSENNLQNLKQIDKQKSGDYNSQSSSLSSNIYSSSSNQKTEIPNAEQQEKLVDLKKVPQQNYLSFSEQQESSLPVANNTQNQNHGFNKGLGQGLLDWDQIKSINLVPTKQLKQQQSKDNVLNMLQTMPTKSSQDKEFEQLDVQENQQDEQGVTSNVQEQTKSNKFYTTESGLLNFSKSTSNSKFFRNKFLERGVKKGS